MSCYIIYYKNGAKMMRPVGSREEYVALRGSAAQKTTVDAVRRGKLLMKRRLLQFNYSLAPEGEEARLKGCTQMSNTVGMDVDHIPAEKMAEVKERIFARKEELGLLMLELSARGEGYHLVFRRHPELTQELNLRWASDLLGVEYDAGAKDITCVFFATTASAEDLIYLDDELFANTSAQGTAFQAAVESGGMNPAASSPSSSMQPVTQIVPCADASFGLPIGRDWPSASSRHDTASQISNLKSQFGYYEYNNALRFRGD